MGLVAPSQSNAGDLITAAAINSPVNQLAAVINGGLDSANLADGAVTVNKLSASIGSALTGSYVPLSVTPNTVTYNGNRSYTCVFNATDQSLVLSAGMRIRTQRTVAAPVQSSSLNGTSQFWSKTAPAGMTFTDNFTVSAWIKVTSYAQAAIMSRFNGTSGWAMRLTASGQLDIYGFNAGAANFRGAISFQSVPLNKWVHVAANLSGGLSAFNFYMDGVLIPSSASSGGTLPTALIQAGNLEVGSTNLGSSFFPGRIAQASVFSAVLTEATNRSYYSQGLTGSEPNLVSGYSFNGVATDLQTTNANNLTANAGATATAADGPFGGQANGTNSGTLDYGIVQKVDFATNTTVVISVAEGCTIPSSGGVTSVSYSSQKAPYGFPGDRGKWTIRTTGKVAATQTTPVNGTWYNTGLTKLSLPIGSWSLGYQATVQSNSPNNTGSILLTLSTSSSLSTDTDYVAQAYSAVGGGSSNAIMGTFTKNKEASVAVQTDYFLNISTDSTSSNIQVRGDIGSIYITAENAYL